MRSIIIGREGNQPFPITDLQVSRKHAKLTIYDNGEMELEDTDSSAGTFMKMKNGAFDRIQKCKVVPGMIMRLGQNLEISVSSLLSEKKADKKVVPTEKAKADISALRYLEDHYRTQKVKYEGRSATYGMCQTGVLMTTGTVTTILFTTDVFGFLKDYGLEEQYIKIIPAVASLLLGAIFFFLLAKAKSSLSRKKEELEYNYKKNYCCPKCRAPFSGKAYTNILFDGSCPRCKTEFYEKD